MREILIIVPKRKFIMIVIIAVMILCSLSAAVMVINLPYKSPLYGRTIVVDAGHGGVDGGTNNRYILEKDVNLDVALYLQRKLESSGATVVMTRVQDIALSKSKKIDRNRYIEDLNTRVTTINNSGAQIFVSIHTNTNPRKPSTRGMMTFYSKSHPYNRDIAYIFQDIFNNSEFKYQGNIYKSNHIPQKGEYYILTRSKIPGVIVETGFISNSTDLFLLRTQEYREHIAEIISTGISNYFSLYDRLPSDADYGIKGNEENIIDMGEYALTPTAP